MKQCKLELVTPTDDPKIFQKSGDFVVCWIDLEKGAKEGSIILLKGKPYPFLIKEIKEIWDDIEMEKGEIKRDWKVGGL